MKTHRITGGGGTKLHLVETGNPSGRPILFIHGVSQCWLVWSRQLSSDLADDYRLVAMDMRGHGLSEKPRDGYTDSRPWALPRMWKSVRAAWNAWCDCSSVKSSRLRNCI